MKSEPFSQYSQTSHAQSEKCSKCDMCLISVTCLTSDLSLSRMPRQCSLHVCERGVWEGRGRWRGRGENCGTICICSVPPMCTCRGHRRTTVCPALSPSIPFLTQGPLVTTLAASKPSQFSQQCWGYKPARAHPDLHMKSELRSLRLCGKHSHSTSSLRPQNYSINITFT